MMKDSEQKFFDKKTTSEMTKKIFEVFLSRSDSPGEFISSKEKDDLIIESKNNPEALKKFEKNKDSKYRVNSLSAPLMSAEVFLNSKETENIPLEEKDKLIKKIYKAENDIEKAKPTGMTDNEVEQVIEIIKEVNKYLK
jgi:hypothetical protein